MASVDTNVLVRLLTGDDAVQSGEAREYVRRAEHEGNRLYVPLTVTLELEWVLRSRFGYNKDQVLIALSSLLKTREFDFQDETAVENALNSYRQNRVDFAECLHAGCAASADQLPFLTFDRSAAHIPGAQLVGSS